MNWMKAIWKDVGYFLFLLVFAGVNSQVKAACPAGTTCLPPTTQYCCGLGIYNFTFNTINNTTGDGIDGYQDYSCTIQTTVTEGNTYSVDIETNDTYTENVFIWIDYNNDSTFDDSEKSFSSIGALQFHSGNMIIGSNAVLNTELRMRVGSDYSGLGVYTPCDSSAYGQFEDYTIIIQANTSPAVADFSSSDTINCNGYVQFTDQSLNVPTSWFWDFGDGNTDTTKNPMYIYSTPGMYSVKLRVSNAFGNDSITKTNYVDITSISGARSIECAPNTTGWCCSMGIYNVTFNGINNTTGDGSEGYQDYTCTDTTTIQINKKYLLSIQTDNTYEQNVRAWIDLNNDGVLDTLTELVLSSDNILEFHSDSIIIQGNPVYNTPLRLRIAADYYFQPIPTPCNDVTYSQVEDYSVIIVPDTIPPVAKFSADATLSCDGIVTFTDNSTNSPTSWFWDFGDGNTDTIQSPTHTYSTDTTYSISLIASNQWGSDTLIKSNYVTVSIGGGPIAASCTSGTDNGGLGFGITNFTFGSINSTTGDASENYQDYTCSQGTNLIEGKIYNMSITVDNPSTHHVRVWADFNNDAAFDTTTELLLSVNTVLNVNQDVSIPTGAVLNTPLRLRVSADWSGSAEPTPCKLLDYGQAEDYSIVILVNNDPPAADFSVNDSITCDGNVNFSDISQNVPTSWFWDFGDGNTDTTQNPSHNYSIDSTYNVMFVAINANGSDTLTKNSFIQVKQDSLPNNPSCAPATLGNCCGYGILNVNLNTINNTSADGSEGYQDFACQHRTYLTQGSNYTISIQTSVANSQDTRAWIDYDNDGFFNDSTELILSANNAYDPSNTFTVSSSAPLDTPLRMRVSTDYSGSNPTSCVDLDFGQAEDYTIIIKENTTPPVANFTAADTMVCSGIINFSDLSANVVKNWKWDFGDGNTDTTQNPTYTYADEGVYNVKLVVSNAYGADSITKTAFITVAQYICDTILLAETGADTVMSCGGKLFDPGGAFANYNDNSSGIRTIMSPGADSLTLTFQSFNMVTGDWLYIYDAPTTSNLIGIYTGTALPNGGKIVSSGNALTFLFYSNTVTNDAGFEATIISNYPSLGAPVAGFAVSDTNPTFGSTLNFTDQSINNVSSWNWDFDDGNSSTNQNPTHTYASEGTYTTILIVSTCSGEADTTSQVIVVQGPPDIRVNPKSFNVLLTAGDSTTKPLYVSNIGTGQLDYTLSARNFTGAAPTALFTDGFEDGTYNKWQDDGGAYTREVTNTIAAVGSYSFKLTGGNVVLHDGISKKFTPDTPNYVGFYFNSGATTTFDCIVSVGDSNTTTNNGFIFFYTRNSGTLYLNGNTTVAYNANQWYHVECKNIDYIAQTFDYYVDDVLIVAGLNFNTASSYASEVYFFNYSTGSVGYLDDMNIGGGGQASTNWLSFNPTSGNVAATSEDTIDVEFITTGLIGGRYTSELVVTSNDPDTPEVVVPCTLNVMGIPEIGLSDISFDFGTLMVGATNSDTLTISSIGTDSLFVTNITLSDANFNVNQTNFAIGPGLNEDLIITFAPGVIDTFSVTLTIYNNDVDTVITLYGISIGAPDISVDPTSFYVKLASGDSTTKSLNIYNNGNSTLTYDIKSYQDYDSSSNIGFVKTGDTTYHNFYTIGQADSLFIYVTINGDFNGTTEYADIHIEGNFYQQIYDGNGNPPNGTDVIDTFIIGGANIATWLADGVLSIDIVNSIQVNTGFGADYHIVRVKTTGSNWIDLSKTSGSVAISSSDLIDVEFNAKGKSLGLYTTELNVSSNDPVKPNIAVPCTLEVVDFPIANFNFDWSTNCNGTVVFTNISTNNPTTYNWDFGDGSKSTTKNPSHTFSSTGTYNVTLEACNVNGCDQIVKDVTVAIGSAPKSAGCLPNTTGDCCNTGIFNVSIGSIDHSSDGASDGYMDYTCSARTTLDGSKTHLMTIKTSSGNEENVRVWIDFNNDGSFDTSTEVVLVSDSTLQTHNGVVSIPDSAVRDEPLRMRVGAAGKWEAVPDPCTDIADGQFEDYTVTIQPDSTAPVADFGITYLDMCQGIVQFGDSSSYEPKTWYWDFGDGGNSNLSNPYYSYANPGTYTVSLKVTNDFGANVKTRTVKINSVIAGFTIPDFAEVNTSIDFVDNSLGANTWTWDFDDGYSANVQNPSHTYTSEAIYSVKLTASNSSCTDEFTETILIVMTGMDTKSSDKKLSIYPNPADDFVEINYQFEGKKDLNIAISNILGEQVVIESTTVNNEYNKTVDISHLSKGVYTLIISDRSEKLMRKFIVQ
ncbi:MAG: hypothetical protein COC01_00325 [Bacteroidetes bacterium]|nr:MAG: hypothetical protein COC01_00325 [Bacteroidota bacterium]